MLRLNSPASLAASGESAETRRVEEDGTDWLVAPAVAVQEDVYRYPAPSGAGVTREYLPADELQATTNAWAGKPLLLNHPQDSQGDPTVIANGDAVDPTQIGEVRDPEVADGKLKAETWIDLSEQGRHDGDLISIVNALEAGRVVETSTGYLADRDPDDGRLNDAPASADAVQTNLRPDHLAVFPPDGETGNCSVAEGCGVGRANLAESDNDMSDTESVAPEIGDEQAATLGRRVLNALGVGTDPDSDQTQDADGCDCGGSCSCHEGTTNADADADPEQTPDPDPESDATDTDDPATDADTSSMTETDETDESAEASQQEADADTTPESTDSETDPDAETESEGGIEADSLTVSSGAAEEIQSLREEIESLREQVEAPQREAQQEAAEIVANEFGVEPEDVDLDTEAAQAVLNNHREPDQPQQAQPAANMAAVPGQVERANTDDSDDVPAAGLSNWESRTNGSGGD